MPGQLSKRKSVSMTAGSYFAALCQAKSNGMSVSAYVEYCIARNITEEARLYGKERAELFHRHIELRRRKLRARQRAKEQIEKDPPQEEGNTVFL